MKAIIEKSTFDFLKSLKKNNNREWFNANKQRYLDAYNNFSSFVTELIAAISVFDKSVIGLDAKKTIFRIYRDVRFSKDKSPYKTHFGANIVPDKSKCNCGCYYFHLEPGGCFIAGGMHNPDPAMLRELREEISVNSREFLKIIREPSFKKNFNELWGDKISTVPKGFSKEDPMLPYLQYKAFVAVHDITDEKVLSPDLVRYSSKVMNSVVPLNKFLNNALK